MSARGALGSQAALAALGLILAIVASREEARAPVAGEVVVVDCGRVDEVRYETPSREVRIFRERGLVRLEVVRRPAGGEQERLRFLGGPDAQAYLDGLAPLVARRDLGPLRGDALVDVGLDSATLERTRAHWRIRCGRTSHRFQVGGRAYGTGDRYIRAEREGAHVVLIEAAKLRDLDAAELRLVERRLHRFERAEVAHAVVDGPLEGQRVTHELTQRNRRASDAAWVATRAPEERRPDYDRLLRALLGLAITRYLDEPPELPPPALEARFTDPRGRALGELSLYVRGEGAEARYYGRSDASDGVVELLPSTGAAVLRAFERVTTP